MAKGDDDGGPTPPWSRNAGKFDKPTSTAEPRPAAPVKVERKAKAKPAAKVPAKVPVKPAAAKRSSPAKVPPAKEPRKPRVKPKAKPPVKPALVPPPTADIIRPAQFAKAQEPAPAAATATPGLKPGQVDLAAAEQALGHVRADIVARLVSDGAPLDRARQFADLILEYAACSVSIDRWGPVTMGNESAWATRRDKVRKALGEFRLIDAAWLWELMP